MQRRHRFEILATVALVASCGASRRNSTDLGPPRAESTPSAVHQSTMPPTTPNSEPKSLSPGLPSPDPSNRVSPKQPDSSVGPSTVTSRNGQEPREDSPSRTQFVLAQQPLMPGSGGWSNGNGGSTFALGGRSLEAGGTTPSYWAPNREGIRSRRGAPAM
jgi:hypothetical protein